jgi:hypothetical protein
LTICPIQKIQEPSFKVTTLNVQLFQSFLLSFLKRR